MHARRLAALICCFAAGAGVAGAAEPMHRDAATAAARVVDTDAARLAQLARDGRRDSLVAELAAVRDRRDLSSLARARLLYDGVLALGTLRADAASRQLVAQLASRPVAVRVWHSEGRNQASVPLYDVAAAARSTLRSWDRAAVRDAAVERARAGDMLVPADPQPVAHPSDRVRGLADAVDALPADILHRYRAELARLMVADPQWAPVVTAAAVRLADVDLFLAVVHRAEDGAAVHALPHVAALPDSTRALDVLRAAAARPAVASAALFEAGRLAGHDPTATAWLFAMLADVDHGGSAAAALARLDDPTVETTLGHLLTTSDSAALRARAALALWLTGTTSARDRLTAFAASDAPSALAQQIAEWTTR